MSYAPSSRGLLPSVFLSPLSRESCAYYWGSGRITTPASQVWSQADRAFYVPFWLDRGIVVTRLWWLNGATVGTNNLQAGIYSETGTSIVLGTQTLSAGASAPQFDNITDTALGPGMYYMALWCNGTTATVFRVATSTARYIGMYLQNSLTSGLPTTATFGAMTTAFIPIFGLAQRASP